MCVSFYENIKHPLLYRSVFILGGIYVLSFFVSAAYAATAAVFCFLFFVVIFIPRAMTVNALLVGYCVSAREFT